MFGDRLSPGKRRAVIVLGVCVLLAGLVFFVKAVLVDRVYVSRQYEKNKIITPDGEKIKSGNLSVDYHIDQVFLDIERLGLNTVNVPVQIDIPSLESNNMVVNLESRDKAIKLIKSLRLQGIKVILEPYPYIQNGELYETKLKPENVSVWFENWKQVVIGPLARDIAEPYQVYALCIASNYEQIEDEQAEWCGVADYARTVYRGRITYKTNWWYTAAWEENEVWKETYINKLNHQVWGKVDFLSVAAYFELTDQETNTVEELVEALYSTKIFERRQNVAGELEQLAAKWNKQVFFGELGFPKRSGAAVEPWNPEPTEIVNEEEQAAGFQAYQEVFERSAWHLGFSVFAIGKDDAYKNYYPGSRSGGVINSWYREYQSKP